MTLTWATDGPGKRTISNKGHVITGVRNSQGEVVYNAWSGEPWQSKHLAQEFEAEGLAKCKAACEAHDRRVAAQTPIRDHVSPPQTTSSEGQGNGSVSGRGQKSSPIASEGHSNSEA
jgi:hypothetical protein